MYLARDEFSRVEYQISLSELKSHKWRLWKRERIYPYICDKFLSKDFIQNKCKDMKKLWIFRGAL
jgi:hypothetical protein